MAVWPEVWSTAVRLSTCAASNAGTTIEIADRVPAKRAINGSRAPGLS
jgi:hypothetical protein